MEDEVKTVPSEMITEEMREAGVDESTPLMTREEAVAEVGEENMPDAVEEAPVEEQVEESAVEAEEVA